LGRNDVKRNTIEKMNISPLEHKRIRNINYIMDDLHDSVNNIYELLVDQEYSELKGEVSKIVSKLKTITDSLEDDI
jgi:negative regulator of replication initiation